MGKVSVYEGIIFHYLDSRVGVTRQTDDRLGDNNTDTNIKDGRLSDESFFSY